MMAISGTVLTFTAFISFSPVLMLPTLIMGGLLIIPVVGTYFLLQFLDFGMHIISPNVAIGCAIWISTNRTRAEK